MNSKLHAACDGEGRPVVMLLSEGQMSDHKGARLMLGALPPAKMPIPTKAPVYNGIMAPGDSGMMAPSFTR